MRQAEENVRALRAEAKNGRNTFFGPAPQRRERVGGKAV
jgi:hypothetical protein